MVFFMRGIISLAQGDILAYFSYCINSLRCSANRKLIISTCSRACFLVLCLARSSRFLPHIFIFMNFWVLIPVHCLSYEPNHEMSVQVFTKKMSEFGQQLLTTK